MKFEVKDEVAQVEAKAIKTTWADYQPIKTYVVEKTDVKNPAVKATKTKPNTKSKPVINTWVLALRFKNSNKVAGYNKKTYVDKEIA